MSSAKVRPSRRTRPVLGFIAAMIGFTGLLLVTGVAASPRAVTGGFADWGIKASFRSYITGPIAQGQITVTSPATTNPNGTFHFPAQATGTYDPVTRIGNGTFLGSVRFTGHAGALDTTIADVKVTLSGNNGLIIADVTSRSLDDGQMYSYPDVDFVELDLTGINPTVGDTSATWSNIPGVLTEDGSPAFSGFYDPGDEMDPLSMTLTLVDNCPSVANPGQENQDGDEFGDACEAPGCATVINHWSVPAGDVDCDGFPNSTAVGNRGAESFIGTNAAVTCPATGTANDEGLPDVWPVDMDDNQLVSGPDILKFGPVFAGIAPNPPYNVRFDLNQDGRISGPDILAYGPFFAKRCNV